MPACAAEDAMPVAAILLTSVVTGIFCAMFAGIVDPVTDALAMWVVIGLAFASGFTGSLFAQLVLKRKT
ncbi:hypothetical protein GCM10011363_18240 [Marivita lacus]|uniref:CTP synthetase n=2 Tax=Marivita lacus TaxID=1323742 RepID=A0ABQ1KK69_9RHOB|nr:hypothetical protein GCM10011363_18240 [Marivita lacus]